MKQEKIKNYFFKCDCTDPQCGKLYIGDWEDGTFEIGWVKYPNRTKTEGAVMINKKSLKKILKILTNREPTF